MPNPYDQPLPPDVQKIWSAMGLSPQTFPIYYSMGPNAFLDGNGNPSGARGSVARLTTDLSNFPHMFLGLRINNTYDMPTTPTEAQVQLYRALKEYVDGEQVVRIDLSQQNVTADQLFQTQLCGAGSVNWHPFPAPFPMAGGNNLQVTLQRVTPYPQFVQDEDILPQARVAILAAVSRADLRTSAVHRAHGN